MDQAELLGAGASLLLLGAVAGMCVWCPCLGMRRSKQIFYEQRDEGRQSFTVARAFSIAGMAPEPGDYSIVQCPETRKDKWLYSLAGAEGSRREPEPAYVDPITTDYYNLGQFQKQPKDDDTVSYENILICKPMEEGLEESTDYQNSASIEQWRQSRKGETPHLKTGWDLPPRVGNPRSPTSPTGSPEDDTSSEPDYVNGEVGLMH